MIREEPVVNEPPATSVGQNASHKNDHEGVESPHVIEEEADDESADGDGDIQLHGVFQTKNYLYI